MQTGPLNNNENLFKNLQVRVFVEEMKDKSFISLKNHQISIGATKNTVLKCV